MPYEKIGKNEPVCIADEVPFDIPDSWEWVRLGHVCEIARGGSPRPIKAFLTEDPDGINWIKIGDTDKGGKYINSTKERIIPEGVTKSRMVHAGDFLLTNSMSFGRPYILNVDGCIHDGWLVLSGYNCAYDQDFLFHMLSSRFAYFQFCDVVSGAVVKNLNSDKVAAALFPLPPLSEQKRIVEAIESVIPAVNEYDAAEGLLSDLNSTFPDRLKKSILQWAVQGKLVPQDPSDDPAEVLLARIREEKARLVKEGKIKKDKHESVIFRRDNSHYEKRGSEEICIDDEIPFELPNGWRWCRFSTICYKLTDGSHNPPPKRANGFRVISARNIKNGRILFTDEDRLCDQNGFNKENPRTQISKGDVILGIIGGSIGNTAIYGYDEPVIAQRSIAIFGSLINNKYMKLLLDSPLFQQQFNSKSNGTAQGGIYLGELANMLVPLPPVNEQNRILASISSLENKIVTM